MHLSSLSLLLPVLLGAVFFRSLTKPVKILYVFILISLGFEIWSTILFFQVESNLFLYHYYTIAEFTLLSVVYYYLFRKQNTRMILLAVSSVVIIYLCYSVFKSPSFEKIDAINRLVESVVLLLYFMLYIVEIFGTSKSLFLERNPYFILTVSLTFYFLGTVYLFVFADSLDNNVYLSSWVIHSILNIILNLSYSVVIWKTDKTLDI